MSVALATYCSMIIHSTEQLKRRNTSLVYLVGKKQWDEAYIDGIYIDEAILTC